MGIVCCVGKAQDEYDAARQPTFPPTCIQFPAPREGCRLDFKLMAEIETIELDRDKIAPYSLPLEALSFVPETRMVVAKFPNDDKERQIHCNTPLSDEELIKLKALTESAQDQYFSPSVAVAATRHLAHCRGDVPKALESMKATQSWKQEYFWKGPISARSLSLYDDLAHGAVYISGRDRALRPTIVFRVVRIPVSWQKENGADSLLKVLLFCMEYILAYMCVPGRVESNCLIFDFRGTGLHNLPLTALKRIYNIFNKHFPCRASAYYVCNLSTVNKMLTGLVRSVLTPRQRHKLVIVKDTSELLSHFAPHQLEEDLGGTRSIVESFFPFPIQAGPFAVESTEGPDLNAPRNLHEAFLPGGLQGQLWDPGKSLDENVKLGYAPSANDVFASCGIADVHLEPPAYITEAQSVAQPDRLVHGMPASCFGGCVPILSPRFKT